MRLWQARTKARTESGTTRRSNVLRIVAVDLAQRRPLRRRELQQPGPHLSGTPQVPDQVRPERADVVGGDEEPDVARIGLPQQGTHPVGTLFRIGRAEVLLELADRGVRPPKKVGARGVVQERLRGRWEATRREGQMGAAHCAITVPSYNLTTTSRTWVHHRPHPCTAGETPSPRARPASNSRQPRKRAARASASIPRPARR